VKDGVPDGESSAGMKVDGGGRLPVILRFLRAFRIQLGLFNRWLGVEAPLGGQG
jgi:hypothetical protein